MPTTTIFTAVLPRTCYVEFNAPLKRISPALKGDTRIFNDIIEIIFSESIMVKEIDKVLRVGEELADYITALSYDDIPSNVVHQVKRVILDCLGTIYMGSRKAEAASVANFLDSLREGKCTVIGAEPKSNVLWAAWANAAYSQVHDCNDGHRKAAAFGGSAHPGRVAVPTALNMGEELSSSGKDVIASIVAGYDVATKLMGMKERPPSGAYASAAIASKLLDLDADQTRFAMGISGYHSPKVFPNTRGLDTNFLANGYLAKVGIEGALMAKEGFNGPKLGDDNRLSTRFKTRGLGEEFEVMNVYIKPWPTCRMTHGAVEAILELKKETEINPENVEEVNVSQLTHGMYIADEKVGTDSYYKTCQFNLAYIAACAIADGDVTEAQFTTERIADPAIHELAEKIKIVADEGLDSIYPEECRPTTVEVKTKDGKTYTKRVDYPKGEPRRPLTDDELFEKFVKWSGPSLSPEKAERIREALFRLEEYDDISEFMGLL
jgi:2-methylcitrate dehydratase PrpD